MRRKLLAAIVALTFGSSGAVIAQEADSNEPTVRDEIVDPTSYSSVTIPDTYTEATEATEATDASATTVATVATDATDATTEAKPRSATESIINLLTTYP